MTWQADSPEKKDKEEQKNKEGKQKTWSQQIIQCLFPFFFSNTRASF
jgi:hypothetical protein